MHCEGSEDEAAQQAQAATAKFQSTTGPVSAPVSTAESQPSASSAPTVNGNEGRSGGEAAAGGLAEPDRVIRHGGKDDTGRERTGAASAVARQSAKEEEGLPPQMTFKVRVCWFHDELR